jgi:hypothetical protein
MTDQAIHLNGRIFDTIDHIVHHQPWYATANALMSFVDSDADMSRRIQEWDRWFRQCFDLMQSSGRYHTGESNFEAFWRTLICNREKLVDVPAEHELGDSFWWYVVTYQVSIYIDQGQATFDADLAACEKEEDFDALIGKKRLCAAIIDFASMRAKRFESAFDNYCFGRKFFRSKNASIGWVAQQAEKGDLLCLFEHCWLPFVIRPTQGGYRLIGEAYVHGIMDEEPEDLQKMPYKNIRIV